MNKNDRRKLNNRKLRIQRRLAVRQWTDQPKPMFAASNIRYEMACRSRAVSIGGLGSIHLLARRSGLIKGIDENLNLLKCHLPYHESDHVLNLVYNILAGNTAIEDLELLRQHEPYLDMLQAQRIPDPTTAGDFLRRFTPRDIEILMDVVNSISAKLWPREDSSLGIIDVDGTIAPTAGEKKQGIGLSYKGIWGYHPLLVSLANYRQVLFIVNRSGNVASHDGAVEWLDKAVALCRGHFKQILLRGDTDFSLTAQFDRWTEQSVKFVFGFDCYPNLRALADALPMEKFQPLERPAKYEVRTEERQTRANTKERIVVEKEYKNIRLLSEDVAEFRYQPTKCSREYRMVVVRKNLSVEKGEAVLFDDVRYFFYITNDEEMSKEEVVFHANARCEQENLIEQLKNGVNAMRVPVYDLNSNWAYMVIASMAWTLKSWFGLTLRREADQEQIMRMEFKCFLNAIVRIPAQVVRQARRIVLRLLAYTPHARLIFASSDNTMHLCSG